MILDHDYQALKNVSLRIKKCIHGIVMFGSESVMTCNYAITSVANTLNKIYLITNILNEFTSTYYDDNNDSFTIYFSTIYN